MRKLLFLLVACWIAAFSANAQDYKAYVGTSFTGAPAGYNTGNSLPLISTNPPTFQGTVTIQPDQYFSVWTNVFGNFFAMGPVKNGDDGIIQEIEFSEEMTTVTNSQSGGTLQMTDDGAWQLKNTVPCELKITFNVGTGLLTIENLTDLSGSTGELPEKLFVATATAMTGTPQPASGDQYLTYNEGTNTYTGEVTFVKGVSGAFRFYYEGDSSRFLNPLGSPYGTLSTATFPQTLTGMWESNKAARWYINSWPQGATQATVFMTVNCENWSIEVTGEAPAPPVPDAIYVFASTILTGDSEGAGSTTPVNVATLTKGEGNVFTGSFDVTAATNQFYLSSSQTFASKMDRYMATAASSFNFTPTANTFTFPVMLSGSNQFETPVQGTINLSFDFDKMQLTGEMTIAEPEYSYVLEGAIFFNRGNSLAMSLDEETGVWSATFAAQPETFNIKKMDGDKLVATLGPTPGTGAMTGYREYPATETTDKWTLSADIVKTTGMDVTLEFNPETMILNVPEPVKEPVDFNKFTANPTNVDSDGLYGMTFEWDYPVQVLDPSLVYIQTPTYDELTGTDGLNVKAEGNKLIIDVVNAPITNPDNTWEAWTWAGVKQGGISVNGQTLNEENGISVQLTWAPGNGVSVSEPEYTPRKGLNAASTISEITVNWPGFYVGYSDVTDSWENVSKAVKIYKEQLGSYEYTYANPIEVTVKGSGEQYMGNSKKWFTNIVITPAETLDDPTVQYLLVIPSETLGFKEIDTEDTVDTYTYAIDAIYTVTGANNIEVSPRQYSDVSYKDWKGLVISNAEAAGISVTDASQIKLYQGYVSASDVKNQTVAPLASGVNASTDDDTIVITFDADIYNGTYTIMVLDGALAGLPEKIDSSYPLYLEGMAAGYNIGVRFQISDRQIDINSIPVTANPTEEGSLEKIESVMVYWGEYLPLSDPNNPDLPEMLAADFGSTGKSVKGTMKANGETTDIEWAISRQPVYGDADEAEPEYYNYALVYTPEAAITTPGEYAFTVPAGSVSVYVNQQNQLPNAEVTLQYTVTAPVELPQWTSIPADGAILQYGEDMVKIQWDNHKLILNEEAASGVTVLQNGENVCYLSTITESNPEGEENDPNYQPNEDNTLALMLDVFIGFGDEGTYTVNVPAGVVNVVVDGVQVPNEAISFSYTVDRNAGIKYYDGEVTVTPACINGSTATVYELSTVTLSFGDNPVSVENPADIYVIANGGTRQALNASQVSVAGNELVLNVSKFVTGLGSYEVVVPDGTVSINIDGDTYMNVDLFYTYNVVERPYFEAELEYTPELDTEITGSFPTFIAAWKGITLDLGEGIQTGQAVVLDKNTVKLFLNGVEDTRWRSWMGSSVKAVNIEGSNEAGSDPGIGDDDDQTSDGEYGTFNLGSIQISLGDGAQYFIPDNTEIKIVINSGIVKDTEGALNPEVTMTYFKPGIKLPEATVTPASGSELSEVPVITLSWEGFGINVYNPETVTYTINGGEALKAQAKAIDLGFGGMDECGNAVQLTLGENTVEGTYTYVVTVPVDAFQIYDVDFNQYTLDEPLVLTYTVVIPHTAAGTLVFDTPFDYTVAAPGKDANVVAVPVSLDIDDTLEYQAFQFDVTLPAGLQVSGATLNEAIATEKGADIYVSQIDKTGNVYRVAALLSLEGKGFDLLENIASFNVTVTENSDIEEGLYDVTLSGIDFSTTMGQDVKYADFQGQVDVTIEEIPVETLAFRGAELLFPSINNLWDYVEDPFYGVFTVGQELEITLEILPENYTTDVTVTTNVEGVTVTLDEQTGLWILESEGAEISEETRVTLTATANDGDDIVTATTTLSIKPVLLGDANFNDEVTVADVVSTANYVAELYDEIAIFDYPNGNVVDDEEINTDDVTAIVNIVLGKESDDSKQNIRRQAVSIANNDRLVADSFRASKAQAALGVNLENSNAYSALQATVIVPEGMTVYGVTAGPRAAAHELVYNMVDGKVYVVLYSLTNASFAEGDGALFNILYTADSNCDELVIEAIHASDARSNGYDLQYEGGLNASATGIGAIEADIENGARYFDVNGYEVRNPEAGQILIRVKGNESTKVLVK